MLTSKQRATLRSIASTSETIGQIGKGGVNDTTVNEIELALKARELVKYRVLETSPVSPREVAEELAKKTRAEVVSVIGSRFILYKKNYEKPVIKL